jgi:hypothetical protein
LKPESAEIHPSAEIRLRGAHSGLRRLRVHYVFSKIFTTAVVDHFDPQLLVAAFPNPTKQMAGMTGCSIPTRGYISRHSLRRGIRLIRRRERREPAGTPDHPVSVIG